MLTRGSGLLDLSRELNRGNVSLAQYFALGYLEQKGELTTKDLGAKLGHSTAAATGLMDRLEKLGYVQRFTLVSDRRSVTWKMTSKGSDLIREMREVLADSLLEMLAGESDVRSTPNEADLVEALSKGLPDEFWKTYQALKEKARNSDLPESELSLLTSMSDQIEQADAVRLEAAAKLATVRGVSFDTVVTQFEIGAVAH